MNDLSLFIYFAGMVDSLKFFLVISGVFFIITSFIVYMNTLVDLRINPSWKILAIMVVSVVALFIAVFLPSKKTLYLIAGSEIGETVIKSEEGKEVLEDIRAILKGQLKELNR